MIIGVDKGHPVGCGANGIMSETDGNRLIGDAVIADLVRRGHTAVDCTYDINIDELENRVRLANAQYLDYFLSIHMDSYWDASANGVGVYTVAGSSAEPMASKLCASVSASCGYTNRGLRSANLYVLRNTVAPAMLIECGFVSNQDDCERFNPEKIATAIVDSLLGEVSTHPPIQAYPLPNPTQDAPKCVLCDDWVSRLQAECNKQKFSSQKVDGIPGIITLNGCPTVKNGARGNISKLLQERLISLGFWCGYSGADGLFFGETDSAVKAFQRSRGLVADGIVGKRTWSALLGI